MKKIMDILMAVIVTVFSVSLLYYYKAVSENVIESIKTCINVIIPSLFPFMTVSGIIISSGLYRQLSMPFSPISRRVFHINAELFSIFLISSVGGYPIGAKLLMSLYSEGKTDKATAEKMLGFCFMGGPAFFIGAAGIKIYNSVYIGGIIFLSIFFANLITMLLFGIRSEVPPKVKIRSKPEFSLDGIISSINSGGIGIAKICASIVFFAALLAVLDASGILGSFSNCLSKVTHVSPQICYILLRSFFEISNISAITSDIIFLPIVTAMLSFGGLCVMMQIEGIIGNKLSTHYFLICRIISTISSYLCCKIFILVFDISNFIQVSAPIGEFVQQNSPIPSLFLLIMTILLLSKNIIEKNKKM